MTTVEVLGRGDELTDGTGGSVHTVTGAAIRPYRKSRLNPEDLLKALKESGAS